MKADIGFFQEQQPNGLISNSEMRLLVAAPMVFAAIYIISSLFMYYNEVQTLLFYLARRIITQQSYIAMRATLEPINWYILGSMIVLALGGKVYQKGQENKALDNEMKATPDDVKLEKIKLEETKEENKQ